MSWRILAFFLFFTGMGYQGSSQTTAIFHTNGKALSTISINFNVFSVVDRPERPLELIVYNQSKHELYIPFVDKNDQVNQRTFIYRLTGKGFEYAGMQ